MLHVDHLQASLMAGLPLLCQHHTLPYQHSSYPCQAQGVVGGATAGSQGARPQSGRQLGAHAWSVAPHQHRSGEKGPWVGMREGSGRQVPVATAWSACFRPCLTPGSAAAVVPACHVWLMRVSLAPWHACRPEDPVQCMRCAVWAAEAQGPQERDHWRRWWQGEGQGRGRGARRWSRIRRGPGRASSETGEWGAAGFPVRF
jgi:hypothetical protein